MPARAGRARRGAGVWYQHAMSTTNVRKVVLAYSGGLDTSVAVRWIATEVSSPPE